MTVKGLFSELSHPREIIRNFIPGWFAVNMGTGITGIVIANFPFPFHGMVPIGSIFFLANVSMFCLFTILFVARLVMFPETIPPLLKHQQSLMLSTIPMGLTTITNYIILVVAPTHSWGIELAYVLWWIEFVLTLFSIFGIPFCMMRHQTHKVDLMNAAWLLPLVPAVVTGASGCYLSRYLEGHRAPMILTISSITLGCGLSLALPVIGIYFYRLVAHDLPSEDVIITAFLPVGPLGQGTYGIIEMGWAFQKVFGDKLAPGFGNSAFTVCLIIAFFLWGYGIWYLTFAVVSVLARWRSSSRIPFNMGWWGLTFPVGVLTAGTLNIGLAADSRFFLGITSLFVCSLVLIWFLVALWTLPRVYSGNIFEAPCLQDKPAPQRPDIEKPIDHQEC